MTSLIRAECLKLRKRLMVKILLLVLIAFPLFGFLGNYYLVANPPKDVPPQMMADMEKTVERARDQIQLPDSITYIFETIGGIGVLFMIILGASFIGSEYSWGTLRTLLTREPRRKRFLLAKLAALALATIIGMSFALLVGVILSVIFTKMLGEPVNLNFLSLSFLWDFLKMFARTGLVLFSWLLLAYCVTILTGSTVAGIAVGIAYSFIEGLVTAIPAVAKVIEKIIPYLLSYNGNVLLTAGREVTVAVGFGGPLPEAPSPLHATIVLLVYSGIFLAISLYAFQKKDVTV